MSIVTVPSTLNGQRVVAAFLQAAGQGTVEVWHGIVDAPNRCHGTDNPARRFVFFTDSRVDANGWGSCSYDLSWGEAVEKFQTKLHSQRHAMQYSFVAEGYSLNGTVDGLAAQMLSEYAVSHGDRLDSQTVRLVQDDQPHQIDIVEAANAFIARLHTDALGGVSTATARRLTHSMHKFGCLYGETEDDGTEVVCHGCEAYNEVVDRWSL